MSIFKLKVAILHGLLGIGCLLLALYMVIFGEVPTIWGDGPLIVLEGIDRFMCIYPIGLGLLFCYKAKHEYDNMLDVVK